jgi:hypothetical protein
MQTTMQNSGKPGMKARARSEDSKESKMLAILRARPDGLNRFEAEHFGDHCLHSTICSLRKKGYTIQDEWEWTQTRFGDVHVKRYRYASLPQAAR